LETYTFGNRLIYTIAPAIESLQEIEEFVNFKEREGEKTITDPSLVVIFFDTPTISSVVRAGEFIVKTASPTSIAPMKEQFLISMFCRSWV